MSGDRLRLAVHGAHGRMGARIVALARADARFDLRAELDRSAGAAEGEAAAASASAPTTRGELDVLIDFSSPEGTRAAAAIAANAHAALLVGTTGLDPATLTQLRELAKRIPVLLAPNTSLGVAVLRHLVREAARRLPGFDLDIVEAHHIRKKDAPSGTALALAEAARAGGVEVPPERLHALRGGDVIGEHTVQFAGPGETIRLSHSAVSRDLFALGALRAAAWLAGRAPGWYSMEDVVGLDSGPSIGEHARR